MNGFVYKYVGVGLRVGNGSGSGSSGQNIDGFKTRLDFLMDPK